MMDIGIVSLIVAGVSAVVVIILVIAGMVDRFRDRQRIREDIEFILHEGSLVSKRPEKGWLAGELVVSLAFYRECNVVDDCQRELSIIAKHLKAVKIKYSDHQYTVFYGNREIRQECPRVDFIFIDRESAEMAINRLLELGVEE